MADKPTDEALENLFVEETGFDTDDFPAAIFGFARAVLEKWGQPSVAGEVDRADAVNLARNCLGAYNCAITKKGIRVLAEAVLSMDSALSTPQPTQTQAGAVPLTPDQIAEIADAAHREYNRLVSSGQCAPRWSAVFAHLLEMHHGIKGDQHVE